MNSIPANIHDGQRNDILWRVSNCIEATSPIMLFLKTTSENKNLGRGHAPRFRWKVYLWQLPDDLVSWYLPYNDSTHALSTLQSFGILI